MQPRLALVVLLGLSTALAGCKETCEPEQPFEITINSSEGPMTFTHASLLTNHSDADACITSVIVTLSTQEGCTFEFSSGPELDAEGAMVVDFAGLHADPECAGFPATLDAMFGRPLSGDWDLGSIDTSAISVRPGEACQEGGVTVRLPQRLEVPTYNEPPEGQTYVVEFEAQEFELPFAAESYEALGTQECPG